MIHHAVLKGVSSCCRPGAGGEEQREVFESALKSVDATFQNLDSSEISLTDVSHYFDSDPTKLVSGLRTDGKLPSSYIADTTTANAQVCLLTRCAWLTYSESHSAWYGNCKSGFTLLLPWGMHGFCSRETPNG